MPRHNVGHFKGERARAHFLSVYQTAMAELPQVSESTDVPTSFGTVRAYRFDDASTPMWRVNIPACSTSHLIGIDLLGEAGMSVQADRVALLDPVFAFAPVPVKAMLVSAGMFFPVPEPLRRRVFSWIFGRS